jgi:hypothetical protein
MHITWGKCWTHVACWECGRGSGARTASTGQFLNQNGSPCAVVSKPPVAEDISADQAGVRLLRNLACHHRNPIKLFEITSGEPDPCSVLRVFSEFLHRCNSYEARSTELHVAATSGFTTVKEAPVSITALIPKGGGKANPTAKPSSRSKEGALISMRMLGPSFWRTGAVNES